MGDRHCTGTATLLKSTGICVGYTEQNHCYQTEIPHTQLVDDAEPTKQTLEHKAKLLVSIIAVVQLQHRCL
jgi:hypothetical protein